jgi:hypothetical protein
MIRIPNRVLTGLFARRMYRMMLSSLTFPAGMVLTVGPETENNGFDPENVGETRADNGDSGG